MNTEQLRHPARFDAFLSRVVQRIEAWARPSYTIGPSLFRVMFGGFALYQLLINYAQRAYLFGPAGVWPYDLFKGELAVAHSFSVYAWSDHPLWFEAVYHGHVLIAALWLLGFQTTLLTPILWVLHWSVHERFAMLWDGGDNMGYILLLYLCFADVGRHFAPLGKPRPTFNPGNVWSVTRGLVHNSAVLACMLQVCVLYFTAGAAKLGGQYWQNGTALYYALRAQEYTVNPALSRLVWDDPLALALSTYGTVAFQLAFPFVLLFGTPVFRILLVAMAVSFHLGILTLMGLVTFGLFMLAYEPLLLKDREYRALANLLPRGQELTRVRDRVLGLVRGEPREPTLGSGKAQLEHVAVAVDPRAEKE